LVLFPALPTQLLLLGEHPIKNAIGIGRVIFPIIQFFQCHLGLERLEQTVEMTIRYASPSLGTGEIDHGVLSRKIPFEGDEFGILEYRGETMAIITMGSKGFFVVGTQIALNLAEGLLATGAATLL
jgi:hypothetical protein